MDLNQVRMFVKVVQAGSFSQAAKQLGIPNSTVSARVSALERRLGVTLLQRTTRKLRLTEAGEIYFRLASQGLEEMMKAEAEVSSAQREPQGLLRVTAPIDMGDDYLVDLIARFKHGYPKVCLELIFTDQRLDLIAEGIDLAMRAGELGDSSLMAKKLGEVYWAAFASPRYLKKNDVPNHPKDLRRHVCLQFTAIGKDHWRLTDHRHRVTVPLVSHVIGNDMSLMKALAVAGEGIALLPTYACRAEVNSGKLTRVLPGWFAKTDPVHLVYPGQKFVAPKVRAFMDIAVTVFKHTLQE